MSNDNGRGGASGPEPLLVMALKDQPLNEHEKREGGRHTSLALLTLHMAKAVRIHMQGQGMMELVYTAAMMVAPFPRTELNYPA